MLANLSAMSTMLALPKLNWVYRIYVDKKMFLTLCAEYGMGNESEEGTDRWEQKNCMNIISAFETI